MVFLAATPVWLFGIGVIAAGVIAGVAAYYGVQSIRQGLLLKRVVPPSMLQNTIGQAVAVSGRAERQGEQGHDPMKSGALWIRTRVQEYRRRYSSGRSGSRGGWHTVSTDEEPFPFVLQVGNQSIQVRNQPTEVHGAERRVGYQGSTGMGGILSMFGGSRGMRTIVETLYEGDVTVVGQLTANAADGSLALIKDEAVGMLLTGYAGGTQAAIELAKGVVGVLLPVAWLVGTVMLYQKWY
jgi:hypothetical protein